MTDAEATVRFAVLDAIAGSGVIVREPEKLVDAIVRSVFADHVRWAAEKYASELDLPTRASTGGSK